MKIYIVLCNDRHTDPTAKPFMNLDGAKEWARKTAAKYSRPWNEIKETVSAPWMEFLHDKWLFHIEYSDEGDCLWITEHEMEQT